MKKIIFIIGLCICSAFSTVCLQAQDPFTDRSAAFKFTPLRVSNFSQKGNITRIKLYNTNPKLGGTFDIPNSSLFRFAYNDSLHVFGRVKPLILTQADDFKYAADLCLKAKIDCKNHYKMFRASATGTLFLTILSPIAGLACAIPSSLTPPRIENLGLPDVDMLQEDIYFQAYRSEATRIKNKRNWMNFGIGFGIHIGVLFGVLALVH
ncbi:MAG: hypothetical protein RRX93_02540 [Bacteroidales bacterium]